MITGWRMQWVAGLAFLFLSDKLLKFCLRGLNFPSALIGMALIIATLVALRQFAGPRQASAVADFFSPAVEWVTHRWLPCFYAPALVTLPLALESFPPAAVLKAVVVVAIGVAATAGFVGKAVLTIRAFAGGELRPASYEEHTIVFTRAHFLGWGCLGAAAAGALLLGPLQAQPVALFLLLLSATILGYIAGMALPDPIKRVLHPILLCAVLPNAVAALVGLLSQSGCGYHCVLQQYLTRGAPSEAPGALPYGPGDLLFAFLGVIILCFGFKVFEQWDVLCRHAAEVLGGAIAAAAFSMLTTAILGRAAGLPPDLARGLVPRGATLALALPIAARLGAPLQVTAAAVALTGIIGGNFVQLLMNVYAFSDPISRGFTAAAAAHGLGTAAMAAKEPEALPYAGLSYALCGVSATLLAALPPCRALLLAITG